MISYRRLPKRILNICLVIYIICLQNIRGMEAQARDSLLLSMSIPASITILHGSKGRLFRPYPTFIPTVALSARYLSRSAWSPEFTAYLETRSAISVLKTYVLHVITCEQMTNVSLLHTFKSINNTPLFDLIHKYGTPYLDIGVGPFVSYIYYGKEDKLPIDYNNYYKLNYGISAKFDFLFLMNNKASKHRLSLGMGIKYHYGFPKILDFRLSTLYLDLIKINLILS